MGDTSLIHWAIASMPALIPAAIIYLIIRVARSSWTPSWAAPLVALTPGVKIRAGRGPQRGWVRIGEMWARPYGPDSVELVAPLSDRHMILGYSEVYAYALTVRQMSLGL